MRLFVAILLTLYSIHSYSSSCAIDIYGNAQKYPKIYLAEDGSPQGILVDMMEFIGQQIDCDFTYKLSPWQRAYMEMLQGNGMIIGLSKNEEREKILDYSEAMFIDDLRVITRTDEKRQINSLEDLSGLTVGLSRGASYGSNFDNAVKSGLFKANYDNGSLSSRLKMVMYGRIDAAIISPGANAFLKTIEEDKDLLENRTSLTLQDKPLKRDPNYLGYVKAAFPETLLRKINEAIGEGIQSGHFESIELKYIGN